MVIVPPRVTTVLGARTAEAKGNEMTSFDLPPAAVSRLKVSLGKRVSPAPNHQFRARGFWVWLAKPWFLRIPVGPRGAKPPCSSGSQSNSTRESRKRISEVLKAMNGCLTH